MENINAKFMVSQWLHFLKKMTGTMKIKEYRHMSEPKRALVNLLAAHYVL